MQDTKTITIGAWLLDPSGLPKQATEVYDDSVTLGAELCHVSTIRPVPLTGDILVKSGFEHMADDTYTYSLSDDYYDIEARELSDSVWLVSYDNSEMSLPVEQMTVCHVHQLQAFLALCGVEREITLEISK